MEMWEEVGDSLSQGSSEISDLDELEANLYSYVHHERNSIFDEERSAECCVSQFEEVRQNITSQGNKHVDITSGSTSNENTQSAEEIRDCAAIREVGSNDKTAESVNKVTRVDVDVDISSNSAAPVDLSRETSECASGDVLQGRSSPLVVELSSSDDLDPVDIRDSKYGLAATSTPFKECVVLDDSDEEVKIELERVKVKPKKRKKRNKLGIRTDIKLNTQGNSGNVSLDCDNDHIFPEIEQSNLLQSSYGTSDQESALSKSWTPQMVQFYEESWGGEYINVYDLQKSMSDRGWGVDISDEFYSLTSKVRGPRYFAKNSKAWCSQCNRKGHFKTECNVRPSSPRCHRCGSSAHQEYSCNQTLCLTCGKQSPYLVVACKHCRRLSMKKCEVCRQPGHPPSCCPDLWRRFHATVLPGNIITPPKVLYKDSRNAYCCNCASRGHHVYQCKKNSHSDYVPISPYIASYSDPETVDWNNACSLSTNWGKFGAAERWDAESNEYNEMKKNRKRLKVSEHLRKAKLMKLSSDVVPNAKKNGQIKGGKKNTKDGPNDFVRKQMKIPPGPKNKQCVKHKKINCSQTEDASLVGDGNDAKYSSLKASKEFKMVAVNRVPQISGNDSNSSPRSVERIVILSPAQLKRLKSNEGQEIFKYITSQFEGVNVKVSGSPTGLERLTSVRDIEVLRLTGAGESVDDVKGELFQILNNKSKGWEQWNIASSGTQTKIPKKAKKVTTTAVNNKTKKSAKPKKKMSVQNKKQAKAWKKGIDQFYGTGNWKEMQTLNPPLEGSSLPNAEGNFESIMTHRKNCNVPDESQEGMSEIQVIYPLVNLDDTRDGMSDYISRNTHNNTNDENTVSSSNDKSGHVIIASNKRCPKSVRGKNSAEAITSSGVIPEGSQPKSTTPVYKVNGMRKNKKQQKEPGNPPGTQRNVPGGNKGKKLKKQQNRRYKKLKKSIVNKLKDHGGGIANFGNIQVEVGNNVTSLDRKVCFVKEPKQWVQPQQTQNCQAKNRNVQEKKRFSRVDTSRREQNPQNCLQIRMF